MAKGRYGIDPETGYSLCKNGHIKSPDNTSGRSYCKECKRLHRRTEEYKSRWEAYRQEYMKEYRRTEKCKTVQKAYYKNLVDSLDVKYVAKKLRIPVDVAPPELIEIKRITIQLGRALKCQNQSNQSQQAA